MRFTWNGRNWRLVGKLFDFECKFVSERGQGFGAPANLSCTPFGNVVELDQCPPSSRWADIVFFSRNRNQFFLATNVTSKKTYDEIHWLFVSNLLSNFIHKYRYYKHKAPYVCALHLTLNLRETRWKSEKSLDQKKKRNIGKGKLNRKLDYIFLYPEQSYSLANLCTRISSALHR